MSNSVGPALKGIPEYHHFQLIKCDFSILVTLSRSNNFERTLASFNPVMSGQYCIEKYFLIAQITTAFSFSRLGLKDLRIKG